MGLVSRTRKPAHHHQVGFTPRVYAKKNSNKKTGERGGEDSPPAGRPKHVVRLKRRRGKKKGVSGVRRHKSKKRRGGGKGLAARGGATRHTEKKKSLVYVTGKSAYQKSPCLRLETCIAWRVTKTASAAAAPRNLYLDRNRLNRSPPRRRPRLVNSLEARAPRT